MPLALETVGLEKRFGGIVAASALSLKVAQGARHALIGPNGAGKTTVINMLTGLLRPSAGRILLDGEDITDTAPHRRVGCGLARTFQINQLFPDLTPHEAVTAAVSEQLGRGGNGWRVMGADAEIAREVEDILAQFGLYDVMHQRSGSLPYGKQRQVEIALAIACKPRVLLLDEPAAGVPEAERRGLTANIAALPADVTVLLVEHDMNLVFSIADRISVLADGMLFAEGTPQEMATDARVKAVYLGEDVHA